MTVTVHALDPGIVRDVRMMLRNVLESLDSDNPPTAGVIIIEYEDGSIVGDIAQCSWHYAVGLVEDFKCNVAFSRE